MSSEFIGDLRFLHVFQNWAFELRVKIEKSTQAKVANSTCMY